MHVCSPVFSYLFRNAFESPKNTIEETLDGIKSDVEQIKDDVKSILRLLKEQS